MGAIFKREFRAHVTNVWGWIFIAVSIGVIGFSAIITNLINAVPQIEYGISLSIMVMILTIPFLCMSVFAPENKNGNTKFLLSLPIKTHNIVLGKYFATLTLFAIPTLILAIIPLLLSIYGNVLFSQSYASILAYFLIGAVMIAICMFIGAHSRRSAIALIIGVLVSAVLYAGPVLSAYVPSSAVASLIAIIALEILICVVIWILSGELILGGAVLGVSVVGTVIAYFASPSSFSSLFHRIFLFISPFERISKFSLGIFDIKDVIYLLSVAALFIFLTYISIEKTRNISKRASPRSLLSAVVSLILVVVINLGVIAIPGAIISFDASGLGIYSLFDDSKNFASKIDEDVTIYLLSEQGVPDSQIEQVILEYQATNPHIDYKLINVSSDPDFISKYIGVSYFHVNEDGIRPLSNHSIIIQSSRRHTVINSSTYHSYKVGKYYYSEDEFIALCQQAVSNGYDMSAIEYSTFFNLDKMIVSGLEYVTLDNVSTVFTLTGHGEQAIDDTFYTNIKNSKNGSVDELLLDNFDSVPAHCSALIISSPQTDISSSDADKIIEYIDRGGDIILITSPQNTQMPNLLRVAEAFGLTAQSGIINDTDKDHHMNDDNAYLVLDTVSEHPVAYHVRTNYSTSSNDIYPRFPNAHPIIKTDKTDKNLLISEMLITSESATVEGQTQAKKQVVGYSVEKNIDPETKNIANLFWYSSYDAFSKDCVEDHPINIVYLLVSLSYVGGAQDYETSLDVQSRSISGAFLKVPQSIPVVWGITFGLIALILLGSGIALFISRKFRKKF